MIGFRQQVEPEKNDDNTALNSIELICSDKENTRIYGSLGFSGNWSQTIMCKDKTIAIGFQLKQQRWIGTKQDETAANALRLICQDNSIIMADNDGKWGNWSGETKCPRNHALCGLSVQIEPNQGAGDDTSLNNVDFKCCFLTSSGKLFK